MFRTIAILVSLSTVSLTGCLDEDDKTPVPTTSDPSVDPSDPPSDDCAGLDDEEIDCTPAE